MPSKKRISAAGAWPYALILAVGLVVLLPGLGEVGFWDPLEPKYVQGVEEMREHGTYTVASYRGAALPVESLAYWSIRAGSLVFGPNEFGARIGSVVAALVALLAVYYAVSRLRGRRAGMLSAVVLATLPQFYLLARQATSSVFVLAGFGVGLLFLSLGWFLPHERRDLHYVIGYVCLALTVLAGGSTVVGASLLGTLALYGIIRLDAAGFRRFVEHPDTRRRILRQTLLVGLVALVIVGPWIAMVLSESRGPAALGDAELVPETIRKPFHYYFRPLICGLFPWISFLPLTLTMLIRWRARDPLGRHGFEGLLLVASVVTFAFVAMQSGKWPSYLCPMLVPVAVLIGLVLDRMLDERDEAATRLAWIVVLLLYAPAMLDLMREDGISYILESVTRNGEVPPVLVLAQAQPLFLVLLGVILVLAMVLRCKALVGALALAAVAFATYYGGFFLPSLDPFKSMRQLCDTWKQHRSTDQNVGFMGRGESEAYFYCDTRLQDVHDSTFLQFMDPAGPAFCILERDDVDELEQLFGEQYVGRELKIVGVNLTHVLVANYDPGVL